MNNISNQQINSYVDFIKPLQIDTQKADESLDKAIEKKPQNTKIYNEIKQDLKSNKVRMNQLAQLCDQCATTVLEVETEKQNTEERLKKESWVGFFVCHLQSQSLPLLVKIHQVLKFIFGNYKKISEQLETIEVKFQQNKRTLETNIQALFPLIIRFSRLKEEQSNLFINSD